MNDNSYKLDRDLPDSLVTNEMVDEGKKIFLTEYFTKVVDEVTAIKKDEYYGIDRLVFSDEGNKIIDEFRSTFNKKYPGFGQIVAYGVIWWFRGEMVKAYKQLNTKGEL